jgi:pyrrolidone-carboxylate peptidase/ketosteroid isomerase-like protein
LSLSILLRAASAALIVALAVGGRSAVAGEPPVILLTGFEPFGPDRPDNPSWEGIKDLDGREWRGCKLVARRIPVVWGEPLKRLEALADELKPVAVFSFGQGTPGSYTVEAVARNRRAPFPDNAGLAPGSPTVTADGPEEFHATADVDRLVRALAAKGHVVRRSEDAGRYLCEETLYSLETLKKAGRLRGTVVLSHVPPLGAKVGGRAVDASGVQEYVLDLLDAWGGPEKTVDVEPTAYQAAPPASAREKDARALVERYFQVWSNRDMDAYDDCFMADAVIQHVDASGRLTSIPRGKFVAGQRDAHRRSPEPMVEVPESIEIRFEQKIARAVVYWKLTAGDRVETGYDHFTLMLDRGRWRIANLLFYSTDAE